MLCTPQLIHEYTLIAESPEMYRKQSVEAFITQEIQRPSKQWVLSVMEGTREQDEVVARTAEFVLLPDTERVNRYKQIQQSTRKSNAAQTKPLLNWLSIVQDRNIRSLRDLKGEHVPMLKRMMEVCMYSIDKDTGVPQDQVMAYIHYPPSVYQLHVHFSFPYGQYYHRDAFRVHNLRSVIDNLELDPDYYQKITLYMAIPKRSMHCMALNAPDEASSNTEPLEASQGIKAAAVNTAPRKPPPAKHRWPIQPWSLSRAWSTLAT
jgi:hypothetical protein